MKKMLIRKVKNWIQDINDLIMSQNDIADVNVNVAKKNYQKHQQEQQNQLYNERQNYLISLCRKIKIALRQGYTSICTCSSYLNSLMTDDFLIEIEEYLKKRGFRVQKKKAFNHYDYLEISWE